MPSGLSATSSPPSFASWVWDSSFLPYPGSAALTLIVRAKYTVGVSCIVIATMTPPGYKIVTAQTGDVLLLIGIVQPGTLSTPNSAELQVLLNAAPATRLVAFAMGDGKLLPAAGTPENSVRMRTIITHWTAITGRDVKARK